MDFFSDTTDWMPSYLLLLMIHILLGTRVSINLCVLDQIKSNAVTRIQSREPGVVTYICLISEIIDAYMVLNAGRA